MFSDAAEKLLSNLKENDEFIAKRYKLGQEYNDIMKIAYDYNSKIFSDITYCDLDELCGEYEFCKKCLEKLPAIKIDEVLHGALNVIQKNIDIPEDNVYIIEKSNHKILFDAKFKDEIQKLPAFDLSGSSVIIPCTGPFLKNYPIYKNTKKLSVKDFVWSILMKNGPIPANNCIIPLNYQQFDLRSDNLRLVIGQGREYKGLEKIPVIPENSNINMKYWPRNVTDCIDKRNAKVPYVIHIKLYDKSKKRLTCSIETMKARFENEVLPLLRSEYTNFDEENEIYQKLLDEYVTYTNPIITEA
jgi:hypothetical protein